jgi:hypothetical protein
MNPVSVVQWSKTFVKIGVGFEHTATGGKFPKRGHENGPCIDESDTRDRNTE